MMTSAEYADVLHKWCLEVESEGISLFKSGVSPAKCTGLAIQIVEARREKQTADAQRFAVPTGVNLPRA